MSKVIIMQGIPGSGKSYFAKNFVTGKTDWVRINRDDLRNMRGDYWIPSQEKLITDWELCCLECALKKGLNIIYDSTNLNPKTLKVVTNVISKYENYEIEFKLMDTPLDVCIERDSKREKPVGAMVIKRFYNSYIKK